MKTVKLLTFAILALALFFCHKLNAISEPITLDRDTQLEQALKQLPEGSFGFIVWMSNREGRWNVYRMDIPSGKITRLTQNDTDNNDACISYDGSLIAWTRGDKLKPEVWIMKADGAEQHLVVPNASMGAWLPDGRLIVYRGKDYDSSFIYDPVTNEEIKIWPLNNIKIDAKNVWGATLSPDGKMFVAWAPDPRGTWIFSADGKFQKHVHGGCEGRFSPDSSFVYWVMEPGTFGKATLLGEIQEPLYKSNEPIYGHSYFPKLSKNMDYLVFSACPNDQHDHDTSDYELFLMKMDNLKPSWERPLRLTYDPATDRFPDIFIGIDNTPPNAPQGLKAKSLGQSIELTWDPAQDMESGIVGYNVYRSVGKSEQEIIASEIKNTSFVDNKTSPNTKYQYSVSAVNLAGFESQKSKVITITTKDTKPISPTRLSAIVKNNQIQLLWDPNPELDIKGYNIYRSINITAKYKKINEKIVSSTKYIDNTTEFGKTYHYYVTAVDNSGKESQGSNVVAKTVLKRIYEGLIALYLFDEGEGDIINDDSGVDPPVNLKITNTDKVLWLRNECAVEFVDSSMIVSQGPAEKLVDNLKGRNEISIEVWFAPSNLTQTGPSRIVSMSRDPVQRNFMVGQIGADLAIRLRTTKTDQNGMPELDTQKNILTQNRVHLVTTYDGHIKKLYINGQLHSESQQLEGNFSNWTSYPLVLGNEFTGDRAWLGKIYLVAIYNRSLTSDEILRNYQAGL